MCEPTIPIVCRGVRGATTTDSNSPEDILAATRQLLALILRQNEMDPRDIVSAIFTVTKDLDGEFPALAARQLGWMNVPLMCSYEISVPGSLEKCIRILLHWNTTKASDEIRHIYLKEAASLRPDLTKIPPVDWNELESWIDAHLDKSVSSSRLKKKEK